MLFRTKDAQPELHMSICQVEDVEDAVIDNNDKEEGVEEEEEVVELMQIEENQPTKSSAISQACNSTMAWWLSPSCKELVERYLLAVPTDQKLARLLLRNLFPYVGAFAAFWAANYGNRCSWPKLLTQMYKPAAITASANRGGDDSDDDENCDPPFIEELGDDTTSASSFLTMKARRKHHRDDDDYDDNDDNDESQPGALSRPYKRSKLGVYAANLLSFSSRNANSKEGEKENGCGNSDVENNDDEDDDDNAGVINAPPSKRVRLFGNNHRNKNNNHLAFLFGRNTSHAKKQCGDDPDDADDGNERYINTSSSNNSNSKKRALNIWYPSKKRRLNFVCGSTSNSNSTGNLRYATLLDDGCLTEEVCV